MHADKVCVDYTGSGGVVGVMDDGFQYTPPELVANYNTSLDINIAGGTNEEVPATGTAVMGRIIADDNGFGTVGVAFDAQVYGIRLDMYTNAGTLEVVGIEPENGEILFRYFMTKYVFMTLPRP